VIRMLYRLLSECKGMLQNCLLLTGLRSNCLERDGKECCVAADRRESRYPHISERDSVCFSMRSTVQKTGAAT